MRRHLPDLVRDCAFCRRLHLLGRRESSSSASAGVVMRTTTSSPLFRDAAALSSPRQQRQQQQQQQRAMTATHSNSVSSSSSPSKQQQQLPSLRLRMKHFAKIVHPDVLGPSVPSRFKENNQNSLAELNGVLDSITKEKKFPKTGVKKLKFYYVTRERKKGNAKKNKEEEEEEEEEELVLREAKFTLKTNGGDCRNVLKQSLQRLFAEVLETSGSAGDGGSGRSFESRGGGGGGGGKKLGDFTWEASDWANEGTEEHQERERFYEERERQTEEYERMVAQREREERINASSNNKSNDRSSDSRATSSSREAATDKEMKREQRRYEKLQEDLRNMDPLFEGIAFVPWLPDNEAGKSRKLSVAKEVVPKLQKNGWNLKKESLKEVWRGQRDRSILLEGLDGASAAAMHAILRHSEIAEKQLGPPVMSSVDTFEWFD